MARSADFYSDWLQHDGKRVVVNGIAYVLHATSFMARYPYTQEMVSVQAEPVNKQSRFYREAKAQLGDDWTTDVLDSDSEVVAQFWQAAMAA